MSKLFCYDHDTRLVNGGKVGILDYKKFYSGLIENVEFVDNSVEATHIIIHPNPAKEMPALKEEGKIPKTLQTESSNTNKIIICVNSEGSYTSDFLNRVFKLENNIEHIILFVRDYRNLNNYSVFLKLCTLTLDEVKAIVDENLEGFPQELGTVFGFYSKELLFSLVILCQGYLSLCAFKEPINDKMKEALNRMGWEGLDKTILEDIDERKADYIELIKTSNFWLGSVFNVLNEDGKINDEKWRSIKNEIKSSFGDASPDSVIALLNHLQNHTIIEKTEVFADAYLDLADLLD